MTSSMKLKFEKGSYVIHGPQALEMLKAHWAETNEESYGSSLDHCDDYFTSMEKIGALFVVVGLTDKEELKAYSFGIKMGHPMCKGVYTGFVQGIYIHPEYRGQGKDFISYIADFLEKRDCSRIEFSTADNNKLVSCLEGMGFHTSDRTLSNGS